MVDRGFVFHTAPYGWKKARRPKFQLELDDQW